MNKTEKIKLRYSAPTIVRIALEKECSLLAGSPAVQPGGGGGSDINVIPITPDDQGKDDEIEG